MPQAPGVPPGLSRGMDQASLLALRGVGEGNFMKRQAPHATKQSKSKIVKFKLFLLLYLTKIE
jgi:hypothetical protein